MRQYVVMSKHTQIPNKLRLDVGIVTTCFADAVDLAEPSKHVIAEYWQGELTRIHDY